MSFNKADQVWSVVAKVPIAVMFGVGVLRLLFDAKSLIEILIVAVQSFAMILAWVAFVVFARVGSDVAAVLYGAYRARHRLTHSK